MVGFPPIAAGGLPCEIVTSRKTHRIHPSGDCGCGKPNNAMSIGTILLVVLILLLIGAIPSWPHSRSWGYYPSGALGLILLVLIILLLLGKI